MKISLTLLLIVSLLSWSYDLFVNIKEMNDVFRQRRHTYQNELVNFRFNTFLQVWLILFLILLQESYKYTDWIKILVYNFIYFCIYLIHLQKSWKRTNVDFLISFNYNLRPLIINVNIDILCESNNWGCVFHEYGFWWTDFVYFLFLLTFCLQGCLWQIRICVFILMKYVTS